MMRQLLFCFCMFCWFQGYPNQARGDTACLESWQLICEVSECNGSAAASEQLDTGPELLPCYDAHRCVSIFLNVYGIHTVSLN